MVEVIVGVIVVIAVVIAVVVAVAGIIYWLYNRQAAAVPQPQQARTTTTANTTTTTDGLRAELSATTTRKRQVEQERNILRANNDQIATLQDQIKSLETRKQTQEAEIDRLAKRERELIDACNEMASKLAKRNKIAFKPFLHHPKTYQHNQKRNYNRGDIRSLEDELDKLGSETKSNETEIQRLTTKEEELTEAGDLLVKRLNG